MVAPEVEFTSLLFPFMVQADRGAKCDPCRLASSPPRWANTDVVAISAVQMATGEVAELDAVATAAARTTQ